MKNLAAEDVADRQEITELVFSLGVALDEGRFEDLPTILTEDATASTPGGSVQGIDAVVAQASRNHSPDLGIQHVISNVLIDKDGDQADVRANLVATFASRSTLSPLFTLGEVYRFRARRTSEGWRLCQVATTPVWTTGSRDALT
jgi:SnoaL-like domain